ncbi:SEL1-like repeat protein [Tichowtungia aerotolerans]|uniref:Tetratricopeptide repeat protein n=1 Tax=Tichowtungia aerotolerans TaxID=2697043 RepID=A0A6P1MAX1_9BACT|nr:tetratricopeptide repeat protein [Tichowtungia aerotolerans]QHI68265.1 tetratricopeptide repeat protein [Tichowtungia aerotolerans]
MAKQYMFYSAEEALDKAFSLLDEGNQMEAEEVVGWTAYRDVENSELLFAEAVMGRSRWNKRLASKCFHFLLQNAPAGSVISEASDLALQLDQEVVPDGSLARLIQLSDENSDNVYLLWLSAIQCRAQKEGEPGKQRYEKLLSRFTVASVMVHHTYANILTEYLDEYDEAIKHRKIAVEMSPTGWTYQGLANTLKKMKRYEDSCAAWEKCIEQDPDDSDYWRQWANTLYEMKQYEEALEKYEKSAALDPAYRYTYYRIGRCKRRLKQYDERMLSAFRTSADMGYAASMYEVASCYEHGRGCGANAVMAVAWYRKSWEHDYDPGRRALARCLQRGAGGETNTVEAARLFRIGADTGTKYDQTEMGRCCAFGLGAPQDWSEAARYLQLAADQGEVLAKHMLAQCYARGLGVEKDEREANRLFEDAVEHRSNRPGMMLVYSLFLVNCDSPELRDQERALAFLNNALDIKYNGVYCCVLPRKDVDSPKTAVVDLADELLEYWEKDLSDGEDRVQLIERLGEFKEKTMGQLL